MESFLNQDYPDFEIRVLDDEFTDSTSSILSSLFQANPKLKVITGKPLPAGWMGKNWACHQLSKAATGEYLLFTDADTIHHPTTLRESISAVLDQKADLLTAVPFEQLGSLGEKITLPYIFFSFLAFVPIGLAHRLRQSSLCFAIGQFMLFKRSSYLTIGGHKGIKNIAMEDLALGRKIKHAGFRWRVVDGGKQIKCRMYQGFNETWNGLIKFLFLGYEGQIVSLLLIWLLLSYAFLGPVIFTFVALLGNPLPAFPLPFNLLAIGLTLILWGGAYWRMRFPVYLAFFYPITLGMNLIMTICSMILTLSGQTTWKGRTILKQES